MSKKLDYHKSVDYETADPAKVLAQKEGKATAKNMPFKYKEVVGTRGESAYVFDMGGLYGALVQEGLGTKSLIAQAIYKQTGKSYFAEVAQDTVATFINDLVSVGATPVVTNAYWSSSSYAWLSDKKLTTDFIKGWRKACDKAKVVWGGGETQSLPGVINDGVLELAGSAFGVVKPKKHLVTQDKLKAGDAILLIEASGVHANGISMTRQIAEKLPKGYQTKLGKSTYGAQLVRPTHIYADIVSEMFKQKIDIHYLSNITGHGWRKLMRANKAFTYHMQMIPPVPEVFNFIAKHSGSNNRDMYETFNMGAGYAIYLPQKQATKAQAIAKKLGYKSWHAGTVTAGPRQVIIEPLDIIFSSDSLEVR